jgi:hypothetical protein
MEAVRTPLQGVGNVVRFNYHFFILAFTGVALVFGLSTVCKDTLSQSLVALGWLILLATWASLLASAWIYDWSEMYSFRWLGLEKSPDEINSVMNIHAGFDDTSQHLREVFPKANLSVYDFYDPVRHTEPSIARARKVYPPYPGTIKIDPTQPKQLTSKAALILLILSVHEIRDPEERTNFFRALKNNLEPGGELVVLEHSRDWINFLAFNIGFFHFYSPSVWRENFLASGLTIRKEHRLTPFLTAYYLIP